MERQLKGQIAGFARSRGLSWPSPAHGGTHFLFVMFEVTFGAANWFNCVPAFLHHKTWETFLILIIHMYEPTRDTSRAVSEVSTPFPPHLIV